MRLKNQVRVLLASVIALLLLTPVHFVAAVDNSAIGITPAYPSAENPRTGTIFIHTIKPGEAAKDGIRIYNYTKDTRTVELRAVDSVMAVDGSFSCRQDAEKRSEMGLWVKLESQKVVLEPESDQVVPFTINLPDKVSPGEHGGCITAQDRQSFAKSTGGGVQLGFRSAIRIAVTVPGKLIKDIVFTGITVSRDADNFILSPGLHNKGNVSLDVSQRMQVTDIFGNKSEIKKADYPVMPDAKTSWTFAFARPFWGNIYKANTSLTYNSNALAGLGEKNDSPKKISSQTGYFFVMPTPQALVVEVVLVLLPILILATIMHKRRQKKHLRKKWSEYVVKPHDTLVELAASRGVRWKRVARVNHIKAPFILKTGQKLLLPSTAKTKKAKDWVVEDTPVYEDAADTVLEAPTTQPSRANRPTASQEPVVKYVVMAPPRKAATKRSKRKYDWAQPALYYADSEEAAAAAVGKAKPKKKATAVKKKPTSKKKS
ncbi:MAG: DUF916 domain-containing protein [Candidatus Saccharimonadales bacterium]